MPVSWFSAATSTSDLPNWKTREQQMAKQSLWEQQFCDVFLEGNRNSELYFTLSFIWSSKDTEITLGRTVSKTFWKRRLLQMLRFIQSWASWPLGNVSNSWTDIPGYNVIILASIHYNYREGGGLVSSRSSSLASHTTKCWKMFQLLCMCTLSVLLVKKKEQ